MGGTYRDTIQEKLIAIQEIARRMPAMAAEIDHLLGQALDMILAAQAVEERAEPTIAVADAALKIRQRRQEAFGVDLFRDPAWDMLLDLFLGEETGRASYISSLSVAAGVPLTTGLRYLDALEHAGLLRRREDPRDHRRTLVSAKPAALDTVGDLIRSFVRSTRGSARILPPQMVATQ